MVKHRSRKGKSRDADFERWVKEDEPVKGDVSEWVTDEYLDEVYGPKIYDKSLENFNDPEALFNEMISTGTRAPTLSGLLERSFQAMRLEEVKSFREMGPLVEPRVKPPTGPEPTTSTDDVDTPQIVDDNEVDVPEPAAASPTAANEIAWSPNTRIGRSTVHLVHQYRHTTNANEASPGAQDDAGLWKVEWVGALGLVVQGRPRRAHLRVNLKWEGYPVEENTWEPLENLVSGFDLPEEVEKMNERCQAKAQELGVSYEVAKKAEAEGDEDEGEVEDEEEDEEEQPVMRPRKRAAEPSAKSSRVRGKKRKS